MSPLFRAASRAPAAGDPSVLGLARRGEGSESAGRGSYLDASEITFRYGTRAEPAIRGASFRLDLGDRVLLTSPSGGGKSTLLSLVNGLRHPDAGTLLVDGIDRQSLGDEAWMKRIATAPQFHENHVFTETFAFNVLMGRRWPPEGDDWREAEALCRELGLGDLLDKMPGGMNQLIGETGWRLSHGERSRVFLARALLQGAPLVLLDESFAALDPENLMQALGCAQARARSLIVVAPPVSPQRPPVRTSPGAHNVRRADLTGSPQRPPCGPHWEPTTSAVRTSLGAHNVRRADLTGTTASAARTSPGRVRELSRDRAV